MQSLAVAPLALAAVPPTPPPLYAQIVAGLVNNTRSYLPVGPHLTMGSVGAKHLLRELARADNNELDAGTYPGWGYWLSRGATTCWEDWSGEQDATRPPIKIKIKIIATFSSVVASASGSTAQLAGSRRSLTGTSGC